jgi:hypothetical protein
LYSVKEIRSIKQGRVGFVLHTKSIVRAKPKEERPLGRPRCRWEDNMKMGLKEIGWYGMDWSHLV